MVSNYRSPRAAGLHVPSPANRWTIVLAGGEGERLRAFVHRWLGTNRPKQYCAFSGGRTMLEHTWLRAAKVSAPERIITVIGPGHDKYLQSLSMAPPGPVVEQPIACGTAPGLFTPAAIAYANEPDATLFVLPSDHFISPNEDFANLLRSAAQVVREDPERMVLLGAKPSHAETDYGWIGSAPRECDEPAARVTDFFEKPSEVRAREFLRAGMLWNTMILCVRATSLWRLGETHAPELLVALRPLVDQLRRHPDLFSHPGSGTKFLRRVYKDLQPTDFSKAILERAASHARVLAMQEVAWSDWGRPERIVEILDDIREEPQFTTGARGPLAPTV